MARALVAGKNYELSVYKNPKVGKNPPVWYYGEEVPKDRRWSPLPPVVARYQEFSQESSFVRFCGSEPHIGQYCCAL